MESFGLCLNSACPAAADSWLNVRSMIAVSVATIAARTHGRLRPR